ncbi:MAG: sensor histidine kinase, partial [Dehalococcoidia bacterium]
APPRTAGAGGPENRPIGSDLPANPGAAVRQARDLWLQATVSPIVGGGEWAVLLILQDTTEVRRAETTRRDFVANVSHELRTPLAGIKAVVETLRDGAVDDPEAAAEFLGRVDEEVDRLVQLVEELMHLSRIESGAAPMELTEVRPHGLLVRSAERFRHQAERAGVEVTVEEADLPPMRADPERLAQAVGNLVHNAIKFTPPGGRVTLSATQADGMVRLTITDTGSGIDPADLPRIFERFYVADRARSQRGTGLGLAIVKHVVRAHGGTVEVESALGEGSTFTIEIPVARESQAADGG